MANATPPFKECPCRTTSERLVMKIHSDHLKTGVYYRFTIIHWHTARQLSSFCKT
jgi:hypothetical protein